MLTMPWWLLWLLLSASCFAGFVLSSLIASGKIADIGGAFEAGKKEGMAEGVALWDEKKKVLDESNRIIGDALKEAMADLANSCGRCRHGLVLASAIPCEDCYGVKDHPMFEPIAARAEAPKA